ncbi:DNA polymerase III subunit delta' [Aquirhabdus parva]|uniref:DNA-directed DNA polymerase n=1 Tax=Aquirhabdus parva TaxID=2283318 RepID=A0A345P683_9GAMM|nr:DNA polymerase III subunit delta' [Aquirhabdus parva]AXI02792.1 DNA polymerase III subunit delta' [Aquirhabdus parva]
MAKAPAKAKDEEIAQVAHEQLHFLPLLPWQREAWHRLTGRMPNLPHGILLTGAAGTGKRRFAEHVAGWLLCDTPTGDGACGHCASCTWLKVGNHPSLLRISREVDAKGKQSRQIKIDQIRDLMPFVQQTGQGWRVVIFEPAESLNTAAANALLKTLEEPAPRVLLILVADQPLQLPATIRSRVQQIPLGRIESEIAIEYVRDEVAVSKEQAALLLGLAGGAPLAATALANTDSFKLRGQWLATWLAILTGRRSVLDAAAYWQKQLPIQNWLDLVRQLLRDVIAEHVGQGRIQTDLDAAQFNQLEKLVSLDNLLDLDRCAVSLIAGQTQNVNAQLVMENMMQRLAMQ